MIFQRRQTHTMRVCPSHSTVYIIALCLSLLFNCPPCNASWHKSQRSAASTNVNDKILSTKSFTCTCVGQKRRVRTRRYEERETRISGNAHYRWAESTETHTVMEVVVLDTHFRVCVCLYIGGSVNL